MVQPHRSFSELVFHRVSIVCQFFSARESSESVAHGVSWSRAACVDVGKSTLPDLLAHPQKAASGVHINHVADFNDSLQ